MIQIIVSGYILVFFFIAPTYLNIIEILDRGCMCKPSQNHAKMTPNWGTAMGTAKEMAVPLAVPFPGPRTNRKSGKNHFKIS